MPLNSQNVVLYDVYCIDIYVPLSLRYFYFHFFTQKWTYLCAYFVYFASHRWIVDFHFLLIVKWIWRRPTSRIFSLFHLPLIFSFIIREEIIQEKRMNSVSICSSFASLPCQLLTSITIPISTHNEFDKIEKTDIWCDLNEDQIEV